MNNVTYKVPDISCGHCVNTIEMELKDLAGVLSVKADAVSKEVTIDFQDPATEAGLKALLTEINYPVKES